jgi:hypothetical protein
MQQSQFPVRHLCTVTILAFLLCTGITGAALSDHPVVNGISGPDHLNDWYGPTGSYTFMVTVSGGTPPYSYKWMNPPGMKTLFEGKQYGTVEITAPQLGLSGPGNYGIWLTVTDSAGKDAVWIRQGGSGNSNEFGYFLTTDGKTWSKKTEPATFPPPADSPQLVQTTSDQCVDSGARFTGIQGDIQVSSECNGDFAKGIWHLAKREITLYGGDHIKTGEDTTGYLGFQDMSTFILKEESEIVLLVPENKDSKLKLVAGNIWMNIKKMAQNGGMNIDMDQAVAGIKGTTLICEATGSKSYVKVIDGTVEVTSKVTGKTVAVNGGQGITATDAGMLDQPYAIDVAKEQADWDAVKAKALSGIPATAPATTKESGLESLLVPAALGIVAAGVAFKRE